MRRQSSYYEFEPPERPLERIQPWEKWFTEEETAKALKKTESALETARAMEEFKLKKPSYEMKVEMPDLPRRPISGMHKEHVDIQHRLMTNSGKEWSSTRSQQFLENHEQADIEQQDTHTLEQRESRDKRMVELRTMVPENQEEINFRLVAALEIED